MSAFVLALLGVIVTLGLVSCAPQARLPHAEKDVERPPSASTSADSLAVSPIDFDESPELVSMDPPVYPRAARELGVEGVVIVRVLVDKDGLPKKAYVRQSVPGLDDAAVAAVRTAQFKPARKNGQPVDVWMLLPIEFSLRR